MNPSVLLPIITALLPLLPQMASHLGNVAPALSGLLNLLHPAAAAQPANVVELVQNLLNEAQAVGAINFGNGKPLLVDGKFGGGTFAAIKALQKQLGFDVQEPMATWEYEALKTILAKL